ncbi:MAG TPA: hypothetical protein VHL11_00395, partial [Phototrophicaceae bacterium]|nr:hypothetical protein [Phototrophicaceae bacterium]
TPTEPGRPEDSKTAAPGTEEKPADFNLEPIEVVDPDQDTHAMPRSSISADPKSGELNGKH